MTRSAPVCSPAQAVRARELFDAVASSVQERAGPPPPRIVAALDNPTPEALAGLHPEQRELVMLCINRAKEQVP